MDVDQEQRIIWLDAKYCHKPHQSNCWGYESIHTYMGDTNILQMMCPGFYHTTWDTNNRMMYNASHILCFHMMASQVVEGTKIFQFMSWLSNISTLSHGLQTFDQISHGILCTISRMWLVSIFPGRWNVVQPRNATKSLVTSWHRTTDMLLIMDSGYTSWDSLSEPFDSF